MTAVHRIEEGRTGIYREENPDAETWTCMGQLPHADPTIHVRSAIEITEIKQEASNYGCHDTRKTVKA